MERLHNSKIQVITRKESTLKKSTTSFETLFACEDVVVVKIESTNNLADPFTKALPQRTFESYSKGIGVRLVHNSL